MVLSRNAGRRELVGVALGGTGRLMRQPIGDGTMMAHTILIVLTCLLPTLVIALAALAVDIRR